MDLEVIFLDIRVNYSLKYIVVYISLAWEILLIGLQVNILITVIKTINYKSSFIDHAYNNQLCLSIGTIIHRIIVGSETVHSQSL